MHPCACVVHQCEGIDGASAIGDLLCSDLALRGRLMRLLLTMKAMDSAVLCASVFAVSTEQLSV